MIDMWGMRGTGRPVWFNVLLGAGFGAAGQLLIAGGLVAGAGWSGPVVTLLAPAAVGVIAALVIRAGWGATGYVVGVLLAAQVGPLLTPAIGTPDTLDLVLTLVAGVVGYVIGAGILLAPSMPEFPAQPAPLDLARAEADARGQLRGIDPAAPGAFERATALLGKVNQQVGMYSMWSGSSSAGAQSGPPTSLLELQAELAETARVAALQAGARRVTITAGGMGDGIHVQAVFGDPLAPNEDLPPYPSDVD
ncbi:MAG TPA: hypothetical protein VGQ89_08095 [Candidatus Limnocylindrales bacterium]|nr:hypothetical protein [Candidatus Limnocylindrales bacterium]